MQALSPLAVLDRGFAIVWQTKGGEAVTRVEQARPGDRLKIQVRDGQFGAFVEGETRRKRSSNDGDGEGQLSLGL